MQKKNPSKNHHHCILHFLNLASQQSLYDHVCLFVICPQQWNTCIYTCWTDVGYKEKRNDGEKERTYTCILWSEPQNSLSSVLIKTHYCPLLAAAALLTSLFSSFAKSCISICCQWVIFLQTINHRAVLGFLFFPYNCHYQESEFWAIRSFREWIHRCRKGKTKASHSLSENT